MAVLKSNQKKIERYLEWLSQDEDLREPKTQVELARELNTSEQTLTRWKAQLFQPASDADIDKFKAHIWRLAMRQNANGRILELQARIMGLVGVKERPEEDKPLTGDDIAQVMLQVGDSLRDFEQSLVIRDIERLRDTWRAEGYKSLYSEKDIGELLEFADRSGILKRYLDGQPIGFRQTVFKESD